MTLALSGQVTQVRLGRARPFGPQGQLSAIAKGAATGGQAFGPLGLSGDEQADTAHHGGLDKAIHAYPAVHYAAWATEVPELEGLPVPGAFGENLVVEALTEADICLGDIFALGSGVVQVSQSRQPCWKLNHRFGRPDMARLVQDSGRTGWYFRVLEDGSVTAGAELRLMERRHSDWPLSRVHRLLYRDGIDAAALATFAALPGLPPSWRNLAERRLASGRVEDWSARLRTPD